MVAGVDTDASSIVVIVFGNDGSQEMSNGLMVLTLLAVLFHGLSQVTEAVSVAQRESMAREFSAEMRPATV